MAEKQIFTTDEVNKILNSADLLKNAQIYDSKTSHPFAFQAVTYALDTAMTVGGTIAGVQSKISFPFKSFVVINATDASTKISIRFGSVDSFQSDFPFTLRDGLNLNAPVSEAYLSWTAQAGKSVTLMFMVDASFSNGQQISVQSGTVVPGFGTTVALGTQVTLAAATAAAIAPALATRKQATIQNNSGASIWVGDSTVTNAGATQGIELVNKGIWTLNNSAALFGYSVLGGVVNRIEEA